MTSLLDRPLGKAKPKQKADVSIITGGPQVNLLPPEVRAARGLRSTKRLLGVCLLGALGACGLIYLGALASASGANGELSDAQSDTARLIIEQGKYAQVPLVLGQLSNAQSAQKLSMSTDVLWKPYLDAITAVLPQDVSIDNLSMTIATPMVAPLAAKDPLQGDSVGQITFQARSVTVPDTAKWMDGLDSVPGFTDAWVSSAVLTADQQSGLYYAANVTVQVDANAFSHRFDETDKGK
jgi:hypothetical protein